MDLISFLGVLGVVVFIRATYRGIRQYHARKQSLRARLKLARLRRDSGFRPLHPPSSSNPYGTWRENRNEVSRRRRSIPRVSPHKYSLSFSLPL